MPRATSVIAARDRRDHPVSETVILDYAQRSVATGSLATPKGKTIDLALHHAARLRTDDLLALEDGTFVEIVARAEPLIEARAADVAALARIAWHLGDRHIAVQLLPNRIRALRDEATATLLTALGAKVTLIDAPFEPEGGAYDAPAPHDHGHDHAHHGHDHAHHGHDHAHQDHAHHDHAHHDHGHQHDHACGCGHDHTHDHTHDHGHKHD